MSPAVAWCCEETKEIGHPHPGK